MSDKLVQGKITFIHHDKDRAVIEYLDNGKKRTIQSDLNMYEDRNIRSKKENKKHRFLVGDQVTFNIKKTGANGSIVYAMNLKYQFNTALEILLNKAQHENKFLGYIKETDGKYFIKEIESYLFFPLVLSPYEIAPKEQESAIHFKLENTDKPDKITASLFNHDYIPEFLKAIQFYKKKNPLLATVFKLSPFAIYVNLFSDKIKGKININEALAAKIKDGSIAMDSTLQVTITHLSPTKIIIEPAVEQL